MRSAAASRSPAISRTGTRSSPSCARRTRSATTDAQLVARAYRRWGEGLQAHLLGEYAFALFDAERGTLLLGHDALGLVPLFVTERGGALTFATDLAELVGATGVGELDEEYLADCLALVRGRDERTPYRHIRRLLPGRGAGGAQRRDGDDRGVRSVDGPAGRAREQR